MYRFKFYYNDGTNRLSDGHAVRPTALYNDFDGLLDWETFESLHEKNMTTTKILELAVRAYKEILPKFYRIEIIDDRTNEVIDYIDVKKWNRISKNDWFSADVDAGKSDSKDRKSNDLFIKKYIIPVKKGGIMKKDTNILNLHRKMICSLLCINRNRKNND